MLYGVIGDKLMRLKGVSRYLSWGIIVRANHREIPHNLKASHDIS